MPASDSTRIRRDFLSVASELTFLSAKVLDELALDRIERRKLVVLRLQHSHIGLDAE